MKTKGNLMLTVLLGVLLMTASLSVLVMTALLLPSSTQAPTNELVMIGFADRFPWLESEMADSAKALGYTQDDLTFDKEVLDDFARKALLTAIPQSVELHDAVNETSLADSIMISRYGHTLWLKDRSLTVGNEDCLCGFSAFSGEYDLIFSAYCVRASACDPTQGWRKLDNDEVRELLGITERSDYGNIYLSGSEPEGSDMNEVMNEIYYRVGDRIVVTDGDSIAQAAIEYAYSHFDHSGFDSLDGVYYTMFSDEIMGGGAQIYQSGDLIIITVGSTTLPTTVHLIYDLALSSFCGWVRE